MHVYALFFRGGVGREFCPCFMFALWTCWLIFCCVVLLCYCCAVVVIFGVGGVTSISLGWMVYYCNSTGPFTWCH